VGVGPVVNKLALRDAIEMALRNNLDIEIERVNKAMASEGVRAALGAFDPRLQWAPSLDSRNTPAGSVLVGSGGKLAEHFFAQNFAFRQKLPWHGTSLQAEFLNGRQSTSNPFTSLNPSLTSRLAFSFVQPLWRNRVTDRERSELKIRRKQTDISDAEFEVRVIDIVFRVQQAYWSLVAARQDRVVEAENVELARDQFERSKRRIEAGALAPVELAASEAELERRRDTYFSVTGLVTEAENAVKTLLAGGRESTLWSEEIIPADERGLEPPEVTDLSLTVAEAVKRRPEMRLVDLRRESNDIQRSLNGDQARPQMDLFATYANTGLAGDISSRENPFSAANQSSAQRLNELSTLAGLPPLPAASFGSLPEFLVGGYGTSLSNLFSGRYPTVSVGLSFDLTLRNRSAEAALAQTQIQDRRLGLERKRLEQLIEVEIRNSLQSIRTARQRMAAAAASERAAREKLDSEIRLFQSGESTNFLVLTRQSEYADSRRRVVFAGLEYNRAAARLGQGLGQTLENYGISVR
jgi:HAE1 family hydrophobic/amphiphilic exporter-1